MSFENETSKICKDILQYAPDIELTTAVRRKIISEINRRRLRSKDLKEYAPQTNFPQTNKVSSIGYVNGFLEWNISAESKKHQLLSFFIK